MADLPLLGESDRATLAAWNDTRAELDVEHTLHELIAATAARTPYAVAVEDEQESLTYEELDARAAHLAHALRDAGVGPGKLVGMCAERSVGAGRRRCSAILKAGGAYVPIDPEYPRGAAGVHARGSGVRVLLTQTRLAGEPAGARRGASCCSTIATQPGRTTTSAAARRGRSADAGRSPRT